MILNLYNRNIMIQTNMHAGWKIAGNLRCHPKNRLFLPPKVGNYIHFRPKNLSESQVKNTIVSNINQGVQGIQAVGPTTPGRQHDYASFKKEFNPEQPGLSSVMVWVDAGYQGIQKDYPQFKEIHIPHKKPRKSKSNPNPTLTPKQKKENRAISRVRVGIENLIGDMKVFQILAIKFRNHIKSFADQVILVIAGLCNLKNGYVVQLVIRFYLGTCLMIKLIGFFSPSKRVPFVSENTA